MNPAYEKFLFELGFFNIKLGLHTIQEMLKCLGNPHHHPRIIHIAGTNGKGSTLAALEKLLLDSGYSTGSTISPHLIEYNERFRISGRAASDEDLDEAFERICQFCGINPDLNNPTSEDGSISPTFFEFSIAIAFELFRKHKVDYILLETGMGGRLDATNIIKNPQACIITRIAFDHQEYLGDTIEAIALEKLGIVKKNAPVFVALQDESVMRVVADFCCKQNLVPICCPADFGYDVTGDASVRYYFPEVFPEDYSRNQNRSSVDISDQSLIGRYQRENTATALAVYKKIVPVDRHLDDKGLNRSLQTVNWTGRLEYLDNQKKILIDGAHNESGILGLLDYLEKTHADQRILFIIGWKKDKNLAGFLNIETLHRVEFLPVDPEFETAARPEVVYSLLKDKGFQTHRPLSVRKLVEGIRKKTLPRHDLLVVAGSLYLLGEFLNEWKGSGVDN